LRIFWASAIGLIVFQAVRPFLRLLALLWLVLGMTVPVSAWTIYTAEHSAAQVNVYDHHHHNDDGGISVHDHEDGEAPDGGHDHLPSILLGVFTLPQAGVSLTEPNLVRQTYIITPSSGVEYHATEGPRRPPRLG
jgi:hypothetical protein